MKEGSSGLGQITTGYTALDSLGAGFTDMLSPLVFCSSSRQISTVCCSVTPPLFQSALLVLLI